MAYFLAPIINNQLFDANGDPLSGGTVEVYLAGSSTHATTYTDSTGGTPNTWPITLNTLGINSQGGEVWVLGGLRYKFIIKDSAGVVQWDPDNISGVNDTATAADQWVVYGTAPTYVNATTFTVPGDQTQTFAFGTRLKTVNTAGTIYGTVVRSTFSTTTSVVVTLDGGGALDSGLSSVSTGLLTPINPSVPTTLTTPPYRNRITNGAFRVDQRNAGASQTLTAAAAIAYCVDRFYASCTGANVTIRQVAGTGYQYATTITGATSNTATLFGQRIEGTNCYDWVGQQVNVQIPISAVGISTVTWNAYVANTTDTFSAKTLLATGSLALTGTVETKYFSFNAGANAARGIAIEFVTGALVAGQSITYQGAFQAEAGQVSQFEKVEMGDELRRCQRYYRKSYADATVVGTSTAPGRYFMAGNVGNSIVGTIYFGHPMRVAPTITLWDNNGTINSTISLAAGGAATSRAATAGNITTNSFEVNASVSTDVQISGQWQAVAEL